MKKKNISKKLKLDKQTISDLNKNEMDGVAGGATAISQCIACGSHPTDCHTECQQATCKPSYCLICAFTDIC